MISLVSYAHFIINFYLFNFKRSAISSELPGISKTIAETIKRIPKTNRKITILTDQDTPFQSAPVIIRIMPNRSNNK